MNQGMKYSPGGQQHLRAVAPVFVTQEAVAAGQLKKVIAGQAQAVDLGLRRGRRRGVRSDRSDVRVGAAGQAGDEERPPGHVEPLQRLELELDVVVVAAIGEAVGHGAGKPVAARSDLTESGEQPLGLGPWLTDDGVRAAVLGRAELVGVADEGVGGAQAKQGGPPRSACWC